VNYKLDTKMMEFWLVSCASVCCYLIEEFEFVYHRLSNILAN
jgi:hypothetical protein